MQKHCEQSGFLPSPSCSSQHGLLLVSGTLYFAKIVTFLMWARACYAVVKKVSTLFDFGAHCKTQDFRF